MYTYHFVFIFLDAIASPSTYPCSDFSELCELVTFLLGIVGGDLFTLSGLPEVDGGL